MVKYFSHIVKVMVTNHQTISSANSAILKLRVVATLCQPSKNKTFELINLACIYFTTIPTRVTQENVCLPAIHTYAPANQNKIWWCRVYCLATFLHAESKNRASWWLAFLSMLKPTWSLLKTDSNVQQKSWVLCGHHIFNITSILH